MKFINLFLATALVAVSSAAAIEKEPLKERDDCKPR